MADINRVVLLGRLTRDAEVKYTSGGQAVCKFSIAINRRRKSGDEWVDEANFFDVVLWGRMGESLSQYLIKGKQVGVTGELRQERWEKDGVTRSRVEIVADNIQLLGGTQQEGGGKERTWQAKDPPAASPTPALAKPSDDGFTDDIPF
jgi:single-strand DNA-binding protein